MKLQPINKRVEYGGAMIGAEEKEAINRVINNHNGRRWTLGEESLMFEKELAKVAGVHRAIVVNSGSSALLLALSALSLPKGSKVIIPALNFPTAYSSLLQAGLKPVVVDCDENLNISFLDVVRAIDKYPEIKAIVAINIAGSIVDLPHLRKIVGDRLIISDNCIAEGTSIKTDKGNVAIENIRVGDQVLTRNGYRKVTKTWDKGYQKVITRLGVTATPDHKFITNNGEKELQNLEPSDILYQWNEKTSSIKERSIADIQMQNKDTGGFIFGMDQSHITGNSIWTTLEKLKRDISFTIKTIIHLITNYQIYSVLLLNNTQEYTSQKKEDLTLHKGTSLKQEMELLNGINQKQDKNFMQSIISGFGLSGKSLQKGVTLVKKNIQHIIPTNQNIVAQNVKRVFDLSVQGEHEFFANNILVHNCDGFGGTLNGKFIDSYADVSCISMHAAHIITMGEGGAILTSNTTIAEKARKMREWGRESGSDNLTQIEGFPDDYRERYVFTEIGYNLKPLELQCAMGRVQLKRLQDFKKKRKENYFKLLKIFTTHYQFRVIRNEVDGADSCWFGFPIICEDIKRRQVMNHFESLNIETRTIFSGNILRHPAYKGTGIKIGELTNSNMVMEKGMFISNHPSLTNTQIEFVDKALEDLLYP